MSRLAKELSGLPNLPAAQLRERWAEIGPDPVPNVPEGLLRRLLAQRLQEKRWGGLPALVVRELERVASGVPASSATRLAPALTPGARLVREWNGQTIAVDVQEDGFLWEGRTYRSLSEIARAVTGAHWSGPRFFGLRARG